MKNIVPYLSFFMVSFLSIFGLIENSGLLNEEPVLGIPFAVLLSVYLYVQGLSFIKGFGSLTRNQALLKFNLKLRNIKDWFVFPLVFIFLCLISCTIIFIFAQTIINEYFTRLLCAFIGLVTVLGLLRLDKEYNDSLERPRAIN